MWGHRQFVDAGGLMSYAVNFHDQIRQTRSKTVRVSLGAPIPLERGRGLQDGP
jgi:hypothetical protein